MSIQFDHQVYFDSVRKSLFSGKLTQQQVDGQEHLLDVWATSYGSWDLRWFAYALSTTIHETASTMWPIEEYGKGAGMAYGKPDPQTGQTYYGRGDVQLTWIDNYRAMTPIVQAIFPDIAVDLVNKPEQALDPDIAAAIMFEGMARGIFRGDSKGRQTFARYFSATVNDAYGAREIINGDKTRVPSWSNGVSIGKLLAGYHDKFLSALKASVRDVQPEPEPEPAPEPGPDIGPVRIDIQTPVGVRVSVAVNGEIVAAG